MTRQQIFESLQSYPECRLRVGSDGIVGLGRFNDWIAAFMLHGSDQKVIRRDVPSASAIASAALMKSAVLEIRDKKTENGEHYKELRTSYGPLRIESGEEFEGVTCFDDLAMRYTDRPAFFAAQAWSETIREIRP